MRLKILKQVGIPKAGCSLHCFTSTPDVLHDLSRSAARWRFGGGADLQELQSVMQRWCAQHALLSETDCPYMAPVPLRGMEAGTVGDYSGCSVGSCAEAW